MKNHFIVCSMFVLLSGCVSVQLPGRKVVSAKNVNYQAPSSPFKEMKVDNVDKAWISNQTANTISYFSECGGSGDPSLEQLQSDALSAMTDIEILKSSTVDYNGRAALQAVAEGTVDGVRVKMSLLVLKKNGCNYTLNYGGTASRFSQEESIFEKFKKDFRAP